MKKLFLSILFLCVTSFLFAQRWESPDWASFTYPQVNFEDEAEGTLGSQTYSRLIPNPETFIQQHALWVVQTLYWSASDSMPPIKKIHYTLKNIEGISAKGGRPPIIDIFYSSQWIEKASKTQANADLEILYETRGVLYHELTHAYQLEPQGAGTYKQGTEFWAFIEGLADAVRYHNGFFPVSSRKAGGHWMDGYRTTGFFLEWLTCKDPDFLRKFNKSAIEIAPWSFDKAMQHIIGPHVTTDLLWKEYQNFLLQPVL